MQDRLPENFKKYKCFDFVIQEKVRIWKLLPSMLGIDLQQILAEFFFFFLEKNGLREFNGDL